MWQSIKQGFDPKKYKGSTTGCQIQFSICCSYGLPACMSSMHDHDRDDSDNDDENDDDNDASFSLTLICKPLMCRKTLICRAKAL